MCFVPVKATCPGRPGGDCDGAVVDVCEVEGYGFFACAGDDWVGYVVLHYDVIVLCYVLLCFVQCANFPSDSDVVVDFFNKHIPCVRRGYPVIYIISSRPSPSSP